MTAMIDANVLSYLVMAEPDDPKEHEEWQASRELIALEGDVWVSSLAWFEVYRYQFPDGSLLGDRLVDVSKQVRVEPIDMSASELAARLLVEARTAQQICPRCYAPLASKTCKGCHRQVGHNLALNDALIVAHAAQLGATHLYTYDSGPTELGKIVGKITPTALKVASPPPATGADVVSRYGRLVTEPVPAVDDAGDDDDDDDDDRTEPTG